MKKKAQNILLIVAMQCEATPLINMLKLTAIEDNSHVLFNRYRGTINGAILHLVVNRKCPLHNVDRIGTQAAALTAWEAIRLYKPDLIISAGTAGGVKQKNTNIGDVYISHNNLKYHDRLMSPVDHFVPYGIGSYPCQDFAPQAKVLKLKLGSISTGNSLLPSEQELSQFKENNADAKDMEAAAIAEVATLTKTPVTAIKVITDFIDTEQTPEKQFANNFQIAMTHLTNSLNEFLHHISTIKKSANAV